MASKLADVLIAIIFVLDSFCYTFAVFHGEHSRVRRGDALDKMSRYKFRSRIDWYLIATLLFVVGSLVYLLSAVTSFIGMDSSGISLLGSCVFLLDAPIYVISGLQYRDEEREVYILFRQNAFIIDSLDVYYLDEVSPLISMRYSSPYDLRQSASALTNDILNEGDLGIVSEDRRSNGTGGNFIGAKLRGHSSSSKFHTSTSQNL